MGDLHDIIDSMSAFQFPEVKSLSLIPPNLCTDPINYF